MKSTVGMLECRCRWRASMVRHTLVGASDQSHIRMELTRSRVSYRDGGDHPRSRLDLFLLLVGGLELTCLVGMDMDMGREKEKEMGRDRDGGNG